MNPSVVLPQMLARLQVLRRGLSAYEADAWAGYKLRSGEPLLCIALTSDNTPNWVSQDAPNGNLGGRVFAVSQQQMLRKDKCSWKPAVLNIYTATASRPGSGNHCRPTGSDDGFLYTETPLLIQMTDPEGKGTQWWANPNSVNCHVFLKSKADQADCIWARREDSSTPTPMYAMRPYYFQQNADGPDDTDWRDITLGTQNANCLPSGETVVSINQKGTTCPSSRGHFMFYPQKLLYYCSSGPVPCAPSTIESAKEWVPISAGKFDDKSDCCALLPGGAPAPCVKGCATPTPTAPIMKLQPAEVPKKTNWGLIVGLTVGAVLLVLVVILAFVAISAASKRKNE